MFRAFRFLVALVLLPALAAECLAIRALMPAFFIGDFPFLSPEILAVLGGYAAWTVLFAFARIPEWIYVLGHELTHAAWGLCTFSKVGRIRVSSSGGSCVVSNPGMFTTLAPYFVPFYMVVTLLTRLAVGLFADMAQYALWWLAAIGFTYGFHLTYTVKTLVEVEQPDVREYGRFFSYVLIVAANLLVLGAGLVWVTGTPPGQYVAELGDCLRESYVWTWRWLCALAKSVV